MSGSFYTIFLIPEKSTRVKKVTISIHFIRKSLISLGFSILLFLVITIDYYYRSKEISDMQALKIENRQLRQKIQFYNNITQSNEGQIQRVENFLARLRVIGNRSEGGEGSKSTTKSLALTISEKTAQQEIALELPPALLLNDDPNNPDNINLKKDFYQLNKKLGSLSHKASLIEELLYDEYEALVDKKSFLAALPTRRPAVGYFTSGFGVRDHPIHGKIKMHEGLDIANRAGTLIKAPAPGTVVFSGARAGYGQTIVINHGYGLETLYAHIRKLLVAKGQKVKRGYTIAIMGSTGYSTGPHVHYEVHVRGVPVNPLSYILGE